MTSRFDLDRITQDTFIAEVDYHESISSTNTRGVELATNDDQQSPVLILANQQTSGRGRGDNQWWSSEGALTFSVLLQGDAFSISQQKTPLVSLFTGLAVVDALESYLARGDLKLKWPNDVYCHGRKLSGILVETTSRRAGAMVIGIGINVNNTVAGAPPALQESATSLHDVTGRAWDRTDVLISVLKALVVRLSSINQQVTLADIWRERCYLQGKNVQLDMGSRRIIGLCQGIDNDGALLVQTEQKLERCVGGVTTRIV